MDEVLTAAFADGVTKSALTGWLDCATHDSFDAHIYIVEK
jgi:hypothetical protein